MASFVIHILSQFKKMMCGLLCNLLMGKYFPEMLLLANSCGGIFPSTDNLFLILEMEKVTIRKYEDCVFKFIQIYVSNPLQKKKKELEIKLRNFLKSLIRKLKI